jgi:two-component system response regulator HydG
VAANCTAIPEALLESELFGHVRGGVADQTAAKQGLFELADGGTLFLDEVGDLSMNLQAKLLRVLRDREVRPLGGDQSTQVNVRIVCATSRNLEVEMEVGRFLEDLYYRINVIPLHLKPLRERPRDIPPLVAAFIRKHGGGDRRFTPAAIEELQKRTWRGNTRELESVVERALIFCDADPIDVHDLPPEDALDETAARETLLLGLSEAARGRRTLSEITDLYILEMLKLTGGRKGEAARRLGIDRKTLYRRGASLDLARKR